MRRNLGIGYTSSFKTSNISRVKKSTTTDCLSYSISFWSDIWRWLPIPNRILSNSKIGIQPKKAQFLKVSKNKFIKKQLKSKPITSNLKKVSLPMTSSISEDSFRNYQRNFIWIVDFIQILLTISNTLWLCIGTRPKKR